VTDAEPGTDAGADERHDPRRGARIFRYRFGLRARLSLTFALGALALSTVLSFLAWGLTRENLMAQKTEVAVEDAVSNAMTVRNGLTPDANLTDLLSSLSNRDRALPLVLYQGRWLAQDSLRFGQDDLPAPLRAMVEDQQAGRMQFHNGTEMVLVVGVPIPARGAQYYEGVPLGETEDALGGLALSLFGASVFSTVVAGLIGFWASRRTLTPLIDVGRAAEAIAGGQLDTRLDVGGDPELEVLTNSFNEMAGALQDRIERDARFASEVSHELRSPLMTLAASVEVLENSRDEMSERAQTALDLLKADVDRFQQLVEDLLEISRFDVGSVRLNLEEVILPEMVIQAVSAAGVGAIPIRYDDEVSEVIVKVDKRRFGRVIANLLDNAQKYAGGATGVEVAAAPRPEPLEGVTPTEPDERRVQIAVEDEGNGVTEDERLIIFDRFSRGSESGNRASDSGVGLGLALVEEHVKLHGGRVWVEDRPDGVTGARFVIELPVSEE
jgi:two-component system, OmpR family, sensor histidine kinase MtrB